jgi:glycosyltransferase involved in cell wall biosynthesis
MIATEIPGIIGVIPSLNPDEKLMLVIENLKASGLEDIIIVNDGSSEDSLQFFPSPSAAGVTLLTHQVNLGKGQALKTAFAYILQNRPNCGAVVTVDGDGQHTAVDTLRIATRAVEEDVVVLGVRDFDEPHVPLKSRIGNRLTRSVFRFTYGIKLSDTQTGLRGFPARVLPLLLQIEGGRFEYETNMLLEFRKAGLEMQELPIETVYIDSNATSHYRPFTDSLRIFSSLVKFTRFSIASLLAALIDNTIFFLLARAFSDGFFSIPTAFFIARSLSSSFNFIANHKAVFKSKGSLGAAATRYFPLVLVQFLVGSALLNLIVLSFDIQAGQATLIKMLVDGALFFISFYVQKKWVFSK